MAGGAAFPYRLALPLNGDPGTMSLMQPRLADKLTLDYATRRRRRTLAQTIDLELWAAIGVVVALLLADFVCIVLILMRG